MKDSIKDIILNEAKIGMLIKNGIKTAIIGKPNVGKSSLLNAMLGTNSAIVTDIAGTTRDSIEDTFLLGDTKVNLIDTAGIHNTDDVVEKIGVDKAKILMDQADIILFLIDSSRAYSKEDEEIFARMTQEKPIFVLSCFSILLFK